MKKINGLIKFSIISPAYIWMLSLTLLPFLIIFIISLSSYSFKTPPFDLFFGYDNTGFYLSPKFENFTSLIQDRVYLISFWNSWKFASISTFILLLLGYPIALGIAQSPQKYKNLLLLLLILPFWTSLIIRVYAWQSILGENGLINSLLIKIGFISQPLEIMYTELSVIIGIVYCYLPFMVFPLFVAIEKIDKSLIEAATDLGCSPLKAFWKITIPLSLSGIVAGCILVFVPVFGEFVIPDLLGGAKIITVGKIIWLEFFQNRDWPIASAITVAMVVLFIFPLSVLQRSSKKQVD
jgi:putrescine transport system permease protein